MPKQASGVFANASAMSNPALGQKKSSPHREFFYPVWHGCLRRYLTIALATYFHPGHINFHPQYKPYGDCLLGFFQTLAEESVLVEESQVVRLVELEEQTP